MLFSTHDGLLIGLRGLAPPSQSFINKAEVVMAFRLMNIQGQRLAITIHGRLPCVAAFMRQAQAVVQLGIV